MNFTTPSTPRDRFLGQLLKAGFAISLLIIAILIILKIVVPSSHGGWSVIPMVDGILLSVRALCSICVMSIFGFQGWTKNTDEYYEWLVSLGLLRFPYSKFIDNMLPKWLYLWTVRISPIIVFVVLCALGLSLSAKSFGLIK